MPKHPLKGLWMLLLNYRMFFVLAIVAMVLAVAFETAGAFVIRYLIDDILTAGSRAIPLYLIALIYVSLALGRGGCSFVSSRSSARLGEGIIKDLRDYLFDHMQKLSFAYHDRIQTGELIQRATNDVDTIRRFYSEQVLGTVRVLALFLVNFGAILYMNVRLALFSIIILPLVVFVSYYFFGKIHKTYGKYQEQDGKVSSMIQENLTGVRVVRAFARKDFENRKFEEANREKLERGKKFLWSHTTYWPVSHVVCSVQMVIALLIGGLMAMDGRISIGTFVAFANMVGTIVWPLQQLGRLVAQLSTSFVSYRRVADIIDEDQELLADGEIVERDSIRGRIEMYDLSFEYEKDIPVIKGINCTIEEGETVALLGETGSGKSTLVNLLPRFYDLTDGDIRLDGKSLREYNRQSLRENIGIIEQEPFLFSTTIRENIAYGSRENISMEEIVEAAKAASIHESIIGFPKGYDTIVGERGVTLSGGQKQRIVIARTILKNPRILIMDDSTSAVDAETEEKIRACLNNLMHKRTTFIIAHRIQSLMEADKILVFKQGEIIQSGKHEDLVAEPGFYRHVYDLQTRIEEELQEELING